MSGVNEGVYDIETVGDPSEPVNDEPTDIILTRRRGRSIQRGISTARQSVVSFLPSRSTLGPNASVFSRSIDLTCDDTFLPNLTEDMTIEKQAAEIVKHLEYDATLMDNSPASEHCRIETLREMPESLSLKRTVRRKLTTSVNSKSRRKPISFCTRMKYQINMTCMRLKVTVKNTLCGYELWYGSLKTIRGHFGSGVVTYFKFLRWLFIHNLIVFIVSMMFVVVPQLLLRVSSPSNDSITTVYDYNDLSDNGFYNQTDSVGDVNTTLAVLTNFVDIKTDVSGTNGSGFRFGNLLTGEGYLTNTELYYGYYSNSSVTVVSSAHYNIPAAYFLTAVCCYSFVFITLSISMAISYRTSFIQTSGGLKNVFANKIFCGWDFGIATEEAARLKCCSIRTELKELLDEQQGGRRRHHTLTTRIYTLIIQVTLNCLFVVVLGLIGYWMWQLLDYHRVTGYDQPTAMMVSLTVTILIHLGPMLFSWIVRYEDYETPRSALYVTLLRILALEMVVIGVLVAFWLNHASKTECWETSLGQEVYRLILMDFLFGLVGTSLAEFVRVRLYLTMWSGIGQPEFDIARNTMNLIYNQTLFYIGFYFSPVLALVIVIKMFLTFYIKMIGAVYNCKPSSRPWRAAQTQTVFLAVSFLTFLGVVITYGYILTSVKTSNCGPFRGQEYMYEKILNGVLDLKKDSTTLLILLYLTKPGAVALVLVFMLLAVYYLRAQAQARRRVVKILREMLMLQAKDKEFLLANISKVTDGQCLYDENKEVRAKVDLHTEQSNTWKYESSTKLKEDNTTSGTSDDTASDRSNRIFHWNRLYYSQQFLDHVTADKTAVDVVKYGSAPHMNLYHQHESRTGLMDGLSDRGSGSGDHSAISEDRETENMGFQQDDVDLVPRHRVVNFNPVYTESELDRDSPPFDSSSQGLNRFNSDNRYPSRIYFKRSVSELS